MKKVISILTGCIIFTLTTYAENQKTKIKPQTTPVVQMVHPEDDKPIKPPRPLKEWTFLQVGIMPEWPSYTKTSNVFGIKIGIPISSGYGRVYGIEPSIIYSGTRHINGVQISFLGVSLAENVKGIQISSCGPSLTNKLKGLQAVGTLGMAESIIGAQVAPVTLCKNDVIGCQLGVVNIAKPIKGFQAGAVNIAKGVDGVQIGVFNYCKKKGVQFGLINIIEDGVLPFMIIINISR